MNAASRSSSEGTRTALKNTSALKVERSTGKSYARFDEINGWHPWQEKLPGTYVTYPVRQIRSGKVAFFNFQLAKEMGLIPKSHPEKMNPELEERILETFSLQIINEYDQLHRRRFAPDTVKENEYMATRYLQLQHADKTGRTSGDGRSIWNGIISHQGKTWDVSSRGTGVTSLAPGSVESKEPLQTGSEKVGYGCGLAEIDELFASAILSEIFHSHGINTERVLTIVDTGSGLGIGVRAGLNLMRPAHFFNALKQGDVAALQRGLDYLIERQYQNGEWNFSSKHPGKYRKLLDEVNRAYAKFAAILDVDYIFAWLDWDGDNVLADAGIIDYGSIRQFGLRHDQYRYDDVERFSTTLNEQKNKALQIVQTFAQAVDFITTGQKKPMKEFEDPEMKSQFWQHFEHESKVRTLFRCGFDEANAQYLLKNHDDAVDEFIYEYRYLERKKSSEQVKLSDGVNQPALFNLRRLLREYPQFLLQSENFEEGQIETDDFYEILFAEELQGSDREITPAMKKHAQKFQRNYKKLVSLSRRRRSVSRVLEDLSSRSHKINHPHRITGNGIVYVVEELLKARKRQVDFTDFHNVIQKFFREQCLDPDNPYHRRRIEFREKKNSEKLFSALMEVVKEHEEDI